MPNTELVTVPDWQIEPFFARAIANVREELADSPYIAEAMCVLPVQGTQCHRLLLERRRR